MLYRILGSDLPPRHGQGQTLGNVEFILQHERLSPGIERRWILNRIWNAKAEEELTRLLERHQQVFHRIPFDREHYRRQFLDASGLPPKFDPLALVNSGPRNKNELLALEWIYRHKNLAAIGLNVARNLAIELGSKEAQWILPFDGNIFMSQEAGIELLDVIGQHPDAKYVIVPMVRLSHNS